MSLLRPRVDIQPLRATLYKFRSFSDVLEVNCGIGPGFDLMRLALATGVLLTHSIQKTGASDIYLSPFFKLNNLLLPAFLLP